MTADNLIVLVVLAAAAAALVREWLPVDLVAVFVMVVLAATRILDPREAVAGFSNPAVVSLAAVLVLGAGLMHSGVANILGRQLLRLAGRSERRIVALTMATAGLMSAFMHNVGVAALLLPVLLRVAKELDRPPSKFLMPLAFATLLGGMTTLIGSARNLLISAAAEQAGYAPFGLFEFTPVGAAAVLLGILYMVTVGLRLLPERDVAQEIRSPRMDLRAAYGLDHRLCGMYVPEGSALAGRTLADSRLGSALGLNVMAITRQGRTMLAPGAQTALEAGDRLLVEGRLDQLNAMRGWRHLVLDSKALPAERLRRIRIDLAEVELAPDSPLVGHSLLESGFRQRYGVNVLALARGQEVYLANLAMRTLCAGDRLLLQGHPARFRRFVDQASFRSFRKLDTAEAIDRYRIHERLMAVRVPEGSILAGKMLAESRLGNAFDLTVLGIVHAGEEHLDTDLGAEFHVGDTLLVQGRPEDLTLLQGLEDLRVERQAVERTPVVSEQVRLAEFMLAPHSRLAGKTPREMRFRERYGLSIVAIWSEGHAYRSDLSNRPVRMGDVLLVHGPAERFPLLVEDPEFLPLSEEQLQLPDVRKAPVAAAIMAGVIAAVVGGWLPIVIAAPAGAAAMVMSRCLSTEQAYRSVEWRAVILIAGMLSLGVAMQQTGTAELLASGLLAAVGWLGPRAVLAGVFALTAGAVTVMPTAAVAVLVSPLALSVASSQRLDPHAVLMVVALGTSSAFMSPVGYPVNLMVMGVGGYRFGDYARVGFGLLVINLALALLLVPLLFPLN